MWPWKTWKLLFRRRPPNPPARRNRDFINSYDSREPVEYERRAVAFFDILGWESTVYRSENDPELRHRLLNAVWSFAARSQNYTLEETEDYPSHDEYAQFSDNVVVSFPYHDARDLERLLRFVTEFQTGMLHAGLPLRGGVTIGSIYHSGSIVFGPAVNVAYKLESKVADVPRVIVDKALEGDIEALVPLSPTHWPFVVKGDDGYYETDFLTGFAMSPSRTKLLDRLLADWLVEHRDNTKVLPKYTWLQARWEAAKSDAPWRVAIRDKKIADFEAKQSERKRDG